MLLTKEREDHARFGYLWNLSLGLSHSSTVQEGVQSHSPGTENTLLSLRRQGVRLSLKSPRRDRGALRSRSWRTSTASRLLVFRQIICQSKEEKGGGKGKREKKPAKDRPLFPLHQKEAALGQTVPPPLRLTPAYKNNK